MQFIYDLYTIYIVIIYIRIITLINNLIRYIIIAMQKSVEYFFFYAPKN